MARANLSAMLGRLEDEPTPTPTPAAAAAEEATAVQSDQPAASKPATDRAPRSKAAPKTATPEPGTEAGPLYARLDRKETRLRPDQYERLTEHSRRLNRAKGTGGERITENTLIRVAIDMLLERAGDLAGSTEIELRNSVRL
jgi:pyruvate/2-oxoglutarate dehydrogenase complex dihydrolipoamide acyltransferase (E2) component